MSQPTLRDRAAKIVAAYAAHDSAKSEATRQNEEDARRLDAIAADLQQREAALNPTDLSAVADLEARRKQLDHLRAKHASDSQARLTEAKEAASAALNGIEPLEKFFADAHFTVVNQVTQALLPFCENEPRARELAIKTQAVRAAWNRSARLVHQMTPAIAAKRLRAFADGSKPVWRI